MKLLDSNEDLGEVEESLIHSQAELLSDLLKQLSARKVLKQQVQVLLILKRLYKVDEEAGLSIGGFSEISGKVL